MTYLFCLHPREGLKYNFKNKVKEQKMPYMPELLKMESRKPGSIDITFCLCKELEKGKLPSVYSV